MNDEELDKHYRNSMIAGDELYHELLEHLGSNEKVHVLLVNALTMAIFRSSRTPKKAVKLTILSFDMLTFALKEHFVGWKK